jgi:hypothetical protein
MLQTINAILLASLLATGCTRPQNASVPDLGGASGAITWSASVDNNKPVPGIDQASIYYAGTAFVVWSDFDGGVGSNSSSDVHGVTGQGRMTSRDGRRIEFQFATKDGNTGPVTIDEAQYELKNGGLFLVSAHNGGLLVKQLERDLRELRFERASLEAFARNDPEIRSFFSGQKKAGL